MWDLTAMFAALWSGDCAVTFFFGKQDNLAYLLKQMARPCGCVLCSGLNRDLAVERVYMPVDWFEKHERIRFTAALMPIEEGE